MAILRGHIALQLIRELAIGNESQDVLAEKYEVTQPAISDFKRRNADAIAQVKANLDDEFAGMWIAQKQNRVKVYQDDVERIVEQQETGATPPVMLIGLLRLKQAALKSVAEELGQLPGRVHINIQGDAKYSVEGVEVKDLT